MTDMSQLFSYMPNEITGKIFGFLDTIDVMGRCILVSKKWGCVKPQWTTIQKNRD